MKCGKAFSDKKSKLRSFCSIECKNEFVVMLRNSKDYNIDEQIEMDLKALKKANKDDERLPKYTK